MIPPRWFNGAYRNWGCPETEVTRAVFAALHWPAAGTELASRDARPYVSFRREKRTR